MDHVWVSFLSVVSIMIESWIIRDKHEVQIALPVLRTLSYNQVGMKILYGPPI